MDTLPSAYFKATCPLERARRDAAIVAARELGDTLGEIAAQVGLSRERVRQVLATAGTIDRKRSRRARAERARAAAEARRDDILAAWRAGEQPVAIAVRLGLARVSVEAVLTEIGPADRAARRWARRCGGRDGSLPRHSDDELLAAVRHAVQAEGSVPTGARYNEIARSSGLPSVSTIENRLGGWNAALRAAGYTPVSPGRASYAVRWTEEACLKAARRAARELGAIPSLRDYELLSRARPDLPSAATLRKRLGSWSQLTMRLADDARANLGRQGARDVAAG
jgi:hypothetical protein